MQAGRHHRPNEHPPQPQHLDSPQHAHKRQQWVQFDVAVQHIRADHIVEQPHPHSSIGRQQGGPHPVSLVQPQPQGIRPPHQPRPQHGDQGRQCRHQAQDEKLPRAADLHAQPGRQPLSQGRGEGRHHHAAHRLLELPQQLLLILPLHGNQPLGPLQQHGTVGQEVVVRDHEGQGRDAERDQPSDQAGGHPGERPGPLQDGSAPLAQPPLQFLLKPGFVEGLARHVVNPPLHIADPQPIGDKVVPLPPVVTLQHPRPQRVHLPGREQCPDREREHQAAQHHGGGQAGGQRRARPNPGCNPAMQGLGQHRQDRRQEEGQQERRQDLVKQHRQRHQQRPEQAQGDQPGNRVGTGGRRSHGGTGAGAGQALTLPQIVTPDPTRRQGRGPRGKSSAGCRLRLVSPA